MISPTLLWMALVPWDISSAAAWDGAVPKMGIVIAFTALAIGASAFTDRAAGQCCVLGALVTSLLLFVRAAAHANDPFWPVAAVLFWLVAMGAYGLAFGLGRVFRCGSAMD